MLTPEQRSQHALCGAKKKNGEPCRAFAGQGTDHPGQGRCSFHLGNTGNHKKAAIAAEAGRRMVTLGTAHDVPPAEALLWLSHSSSGHLMWIQSEISRLDDLASEETKVLLRMFDEERDRAARINKACLDAGVEEQQLRLAERQGEFLVAILTDVFDQLELSPAQRERFPEVVRAAWEAASSGELPPERRGVVVEMADAAKTNTRIMGERWRQAERLGLTDVRPYAEEAAARGLDHWEVRNEHLRGHGLYDFESDRWDRYVARRRAKLGEPA